MVWPWGQANLRCTIWCSASTNLCLYLYQPVEVCLSPSPMPSHLVWFVSLRFSRPMHQHYVAAVVSRARGSTGVSVRAAGASGGLCSSRVIPALRLPLCPLLLGSSSCSRIGGQHRWEWRFSTKGRVQPKALFKHSSWGHSAHFQACYTLRQRILVFLWVII